MPNGPDFVFITTPNVDPWSGAEELWARTALQLTADGYQVTASVSEFRPLHPRIVELQRSGVELSLRPKWLSWREHPIRRISSKGSGPALYEVKRLLSKSTPSLVVFSEGNALPPLEMLEFCVSRRLAFVTLMQANKEAVWYTDAIAQRYRNALAVASRCYFVSQGNRLLSEKQIGGSYNNAELVYNPVNVDRSRTLNWPPLGTEGELFFACVGRLYPPAKGQDLLFEALAENQWRHRAWQLRVYGDGEMGESLRWLAQKFDLQGRVIFPGFASVDEIWEKNHALVMPSRFEGLPLAMVEAMLCGRPVIATDIAGHREVIDDGISGFLADAPTARSMSIALERFWAVRDRANEIGRIASLKIRKLVPEDPVRAFSESLQKLIAETQER